jgi:hypothetical protein
MPVINTKGQSLMGNMLHQSQIPVLASQAPVTRHGGLCDCHCERGWEMERQLYPIPGGETLIFAAFVRLSWASRDLSSLRRNVRMSKAKHRLAKLKDLVTRYLDS